ESSMINADAFDLIISKANMYNTKVLFMGDDYQLPPIGELKSKVFTHVDAISKLTTEVRQGSDNPNSELLALIREDIEYNAKIFEPIYLEYFNQSRKWNTAAKHNDAIYRINSPGLDFKFNAIDYLHKKGTTLVNGKGFEVLNAQQTSTRVSELFT